MEFERLEISRIAIDRRLNVTTVESIEVELNQNWLGANGPPIVTPISFAYEHALSDETPLNASSHFDESGNAHMVDVSAKGVTTRIAVASGDIVMLAETANAIRNGKSKKGDVLGIARIAGIQATKWTQHLIPLCHSIPIEAVSIDFQWPAWEDANRSLGQERLRCTVRVQTTGKTGIEMEAMTAASVACLTVYDMMKSVDREMSLGPIVLLEKSGGKSGHYLRDQPENS